MLRDVRLLATSYELRALRLVRLVRFNSHISLNELIKNLFAQPLALALTLTLHKITKLTVHSQEP